MNKYGLEDEGQFEEKEWPKIEPGTYALALVKVEPMEFKNTNPAYGEIGAINRRLKWVFDEPETGAQVTMLSPTARRGKKAKLPPILKALNGGRDLEPEVLESADAVAEFIDSKIGEVFMCQVDNKVGSDGAVFNNVISIAPLPKSMRNLMGSPKPTARPEPAAVRAVPLELQLAGDDVPNW